MTPTLVASRTTLPPEGAGLAWGGPAQRHSHSHGLFISFEGIDGAGKSTHINGLANAFRSEGRAVTLTREPGGTLLAEKLRSLVLEEAMDPLTESLLIFAARRDHLVRVITPALLRGEVVLCDRFTDATFAYQGAGRGFDLQVLATLERWVQADESLLGDPVGNQPMKPRVETVIEPNLTIWFDLPPEAAALRLAGSRIPDRFESQPLEFFSRVAQGYAARQRSHAERFARIDASQARDAVWQCVFQVMVEKGWLEATAHS